MSLGALIVVFVAESAKPLANTRGYAKGDRVPKFHVNRLTVITISSAVGVVVGSMFLPAMAQIITPTPSPQASEQSTGESTIDPSDQPTDNPSTEPTTDAWQPTSGILDALEAEYQAQTWLQIADVYNELGLDDGDYEHVKEAIADYTAMGDPRTAARYQALLDDHNALVDSCDEQLQILNERLKDTITTHGWAIRDQNEAVYQAKLERSRAQGTIASRIAAANLGLEASQRDGLDASAWANQIDALETARRLFADSREGF